MFLGHSVSTISYEIPLCTEVCAYPAWGSFLQV